MNKATRQKRPYRQTNRAAAAAATGARILDAFTALLWKSWFEEIRLEDVASGAEVTVQTVIRRFGSKEGLLEAVRERMHVDVTRDRGTPVGDAGRAIRVVVTEYERVGDLIMRMLSQEDRHAAIGAMTEVGRRHHRQWTGEVFAPWLMVMAPEVRQAAHDALVIALDIYVWKILRRDMGRSVEELEKMMARLCAAALRCPPEELVAPPVEETVDAC